MNAPLLVPPKRCAVYCRVSSDERLDQSFNSNDAQKEAGHAFIKSQSHEGWIAVADDYDDGGFSGGNMERPALRRLMADIQMGKVDIVVVYKIDRLTRGIESVRKNAPDDARYERKTAAGGQFMFNLKAANHQIIGTSETYKTEASREGGIASVKSNAPGAAVDDQA